MAQPEPIVNDEKPIFETVLEWLDAMQDGMGYPDKIRDDILARAELGRASYGTYLQPHNGRNALVDAYEEILDACLYLNQAMREGDIRCLMPFKAQLLMLSVIKTMIETPYPVETS